MIDFPALAAEIASQLDGNIVPYSDTVDGAPRDSDVAWIDLQHEREGLRVVLRRGFGAESTRLRASMSYTRAFGGGADYRELPKFYDLSTAAALSRGARAIAAQIETKIVQPAIPMRDEWIARKAKIAADRKALEGTCKRWKKRFPLVRIDLGERDTHEVTARFHFPSGDYVTGRLHNDGKFYIDRMSSIPEKVAFDLLSAIAKGTGNA